MIVFHWNSQKSFHFRHDKKYGLQSIAVFCAKNGPAINAYNRRDECMYVRFMEN